MKNKIGVAIIGCGVIAPTHAESYLLDSSVKLIAACDIQEERAKAFAEKYGVEYATTSADEVFADPSVDAVSICTPHYNHAELCLKALAAGKDVLCEKPLANTVDKILEIADALNNDYSKEHDYANTRINEIMSKHVPIFQETFYQNNKKINH